MTPDSFPGTAATTAAATVQPQPGAVHAGAVIERGAAPRAYGGHGSRYGQRTRTFQHWQELLIGQLAVTAGDTVLDIGCGTGLRMPGLQHKIGPTGRIIGVDASPDMLALAADRVADNGWQNVDLISVPVDKADIHGTADTAPSARCTTFCEQRRQSPNVIDHLRLGAAVAAIGGKWPDPWLLPLRAWVADLHRPFITDFTGFDQPLRLLTDHIPDLTVRQLGAGTGYLAHGQIASR